MTQPSEIKDARALSVAYNGISRILASEATVSEAFDPKAVTSLPTHRKCRAIWDTGATNTVITQKVVDACGLKPIGMARVIGVNGEADRPVFLINLMLPSQVGIHHVRVTQGELASTDSDILIGMDIIARGDLAVTNKDGKTTFSFRIPSCECIDFVKQINEARALAGQPISVSPKIGRNAPCPCGSGKKYKKCCGANQ